MSLSEIKSEHLDDAIRRELASEERAVAGPLARFCTPGVDIGLFCSTPAVALSRNVSPKHVMEMLLTGAAIGAEDALRLGLVNRIAPEGARAAALELAHRIAKKSPQAIAAGKKAFTPGARSLSRRRTSGRAPSWSPTC